MQTPADPGFSTRDRSTSAFRFFHPAYSPDRRWQRSLAALLVLLVHLALFGVLNLSRVSLPAIESPSLVTIEIAGPRELEPPPAPVAPLRPETRITVPRPAFEITASAAISAPAAVVATTGAAAPVVAASRSVTAPATSGPVVISNVEYLRAPEPRYPPAARAAREEGLVLLRVIVDEQGSPQSVEVLRSSGHARLDDAALAAVRRARFKPYLDNGVARTAVVTVPVEFAIRPSRPSLAQR